MNLPIKNNKNTSPVPKYEQMVNGYQKAVDVVDDIILKNYVSKLSELEVVHLKQDILKNNIDDNVRFFKINEMVYEKDELATHKFASVFNALSTVNTAVFVIIDSDGTKTDFYMGIRADDKDRTTFSISQMLKNAIVGQFSGIKIEEYEEIKQIKNIIDSIKFDSISSVSCIANTRDENLKENKQFVQGLEKLVLSMQGYKYTGIIIANTTTQDQLKAIRRGYEQVYTQLSSFASMQLNYGTNSSIAENISESNSINNSWTNTQNESYTNGTSETHGVSQSDINSKLVNGIASATSMLGAALSPLTNGISLAVGGVIAGGLGLLKLTEKSESDSYTTNNSYVHGNSTANTYSKTDTQNKGTTTTEGTNNSITLNLHDKSIEDILLRIDKQLKRMDEFESLGMFQCAGYFMSSDKSTAEMVASTYKSIVGGKDSGIEISAVNTWGWGNSDEEKEKTRLISEYVKNFMHPVFKYCGNFGKEIEVMPCSMVSGNELAIHMGLPRKSVCGFPVIEHADFGKEVVTYDTDSYSKNVNLGKIYNMGNEYPNSVFLDKNSLSMHTFITGSTGSGKSNTIYELVSQLIDSGINFMVIEPAKGEYKNIFGNRKDVKVLGSNPKISELLKINPFKFPEDIHILEHIDRLIEIFNVCWSMYAAMPAVLKDAVLRSYEICGWDLSTSKNIYGRELYPTFLDLQSELVSVISNSAYSEEVKSNYMGSLVTRVKSLTNGLNGQIFTSKEIDNEILFDKNVIVDLSRIGSLETKSLIMGILIMRLSEHRMANSKGMNIPLKHVTILEEAHNILKRTSKEQNPENPSVSGKSVEMISNAIAEMRTYGEGFVIVDQSPSEVDLSAIRNTNTKIIMRLPDETDRRLAGKSAGLKEEQLDEIVKLPKGVAVVYQNNWVEPVLCKIKKYEGKEKEYSYTPQDMEQDLTSELNKKLLEFLLKNRVNNPIDVNVDDISKLLENVDISTKSKLSIERILNEYRRSGKISLWNEDKFDELSKVVNELVNGDLWLKSVIDTSSDFEKLTDNVIKNVEERAVGINEEYSLGIAQCLLRKQCDYSSDYKEVYSAWITNLRNKGVV